MKTDDLIAALAADREPSGPSMSRAMWTALASGMLVSVALFITTLGVREDVTEALLTWRFDVKLAIIAAAVVAAVADCFRSARPEARSAPLFILIAVGLLAAAVTSELAAVPSSEWQSSAVGANGLMCLLYIPVLSVAPLVALLWVFQSAAPASPTRAGAAAGVLAAACGAALYATHCSDDSPLFVATWYLLAAVPVIAAGAAAGSRVLKW